MAGGFIDEIAGSMGWKVEKDTAYGAWQGYFFTVRSFGNATYTHVWLSEYGTIDAAKLKEFAMGARNEYSLARIPNAKLNGIELIQRCAPADKVKGLVMAFAACLASAGAKSGCKKCGRMDAEGIVLLNSVPAYQCPQCGENAVMGQDIGYTPEMPKPAAKAQEYQSGPEGIGGWLILFFIGRLIDAISYIVSFGTISKAADAQNPPEMGYIITLAFTIISIGAALDIAVIVFFVMKKLLFRAIFVVYIAFNLAIAVGLPLMIGLLSGAAFQLDPYLLGTFAGIIVWIAYLYVSRRVRNTFTRFERKVKEDEFGFDSFEMNVT